MGSITREHALLEENQRLRASKMRAFRWSDEDIAELERMWADGASSDELMARFGHSNKKSLSQALWKLRQSGRAKLPPRQSGKPLSPVGQAAAARGLSTGLMHRSIIDALNEGGVGFIDNVLDDGVTTPGGDT